MVHMHVHITLNCHVQNKESKLHNTADGVLAHSDISYNDCMMSSYWFQGLTAYRLGGPEVVKLKGFQEQGIH